MSGAYIERAAAARILDVDARAVDRLVAEGLIGVRRLSVKAKYRRADVEALARNSLVPATPTTEAAPCA